MENTDLSNVQEALKAQPEVAVLTRGTSMRPLLREHRDVVIIGRVEQPLKAGDVPLYTCGKNRPFVLHRILKVKEDHYVIRGDNTYRLEHVKKQRVIGVMKAFYREGKYHNCATDRGYHVYIFLNRISYPFRYLRRVTLQKCLNRVKRILKK